MRADFNIHDVIIKRHAFDNSSEMANHFSKWQIDEYWKL